jgi:hypothetical protein
MALKSAEGYYISAETGKKHNATFLIPTVSKKLPDFESMQLDVKYLVGQEKRILTPDDVSEFVFTYGGETYTMRSVYNTLAAQVRNQSVFFLVVVDGPVSLYNYYETRYMPNGTTLGASAQQYMRLVLQREGSPELVKIRRLMFIEDTSDYFSDCPDLVKKIRSGELKKLEEVVEVYNDTCLTL